MRFQMDLALSQRSLKKIIPKSLKSEGRRGGSTRYGGTTILGAHDFWVSAVKISMKRLFWWWRSRKNIAARLVPQLTLIYENQSDVIYYLTVTQGFSCSSFASPEFRFLYVNPSFYRIIDIHFDVVGKKIEEVIPESSHELVLANYRKAIDTRETVKWIETSPYPAGLRYGEV